jgi:hypothetical protein
MSVVGWQVTRGWVFNVCMLWAIVRVVFSYERCLRSDHARRTDNFSAILLVVPEHGQPTDMKNLFFFSLSFFYTGL